MKDEVILIKEKDRRESYVKETSYQSKAMSSPQETIKKEIPKSKKVEIWRVSIKK